MIQLAVFDVDGTLLETGNGKPSEETLQTLQRLRDNGICVVIASGRSPFFIKGYIDTYFAFDYYICLNGCYVMDKNYKELYRSSLAQEDVESLIHNFDKKDEAIMFQFKEGAYIYNGQKRIQRMIDNWIADQRGIFDARNERDRHTHEMPFGAVCTIREDNITYFKDTYPHLEFDSFNTECYDIHKINDSKLVGIDVICKELQIDRKHVIAFGDNYNDSQMIQGVGIGVAMGNAKDEVKEISDFVTKSVAEEGITNACKHFNLI